MARITSEQMPGKHNKGEIKLSELSKKEYDAIHNMLLGLSWVSADGMTITQHKLYEKPKVSKDPDMQYHYCAPPNKVQGELKLATSFRKPTKDSIFVESICGYAGHKVYDYRSQKLLKAGFIRLRSMRDPDGKYWELWYLPSTFWFTPFKIPYSANAKKSIDRVREWVNSHINPGVVMTIGEHWGLAID